MGTCAERTIMCADPLSNPSMIRNSAALGDSSIVSEQGCMKA